MDKKEISRDLLKVKIYKTRSQMGEDAASEVSECINALLANRETINIVFAAAPSQNDFLTALRDKNVDWSRINAFHMDEYVGLDAEAPQLFGNYLKDILFSRVSFKEAWFYCFAQNSFFILF